jgi:hypothetical protein
LDPRIFERQLRQWWNTSASADPIARRVLAFIGEERAYGFLAQGNRTDALKSLRASLPTELASSLAVPEALRAQKVVERPNRHGTLLGTVRGNLSLGTAILEAHESSASQKAAELWRLSLTQFE